MAAIGVKSPIIMSRPHIVSMDATNLANNCGAGKPKLSNQSPVPEIPLLHFPIPESSMIIPTTMRSGMMANSISIFGKIMICMSLVISQRDKGATSTIEAASKICLHVSSSTGSPSDSLFSI